MHRLVASGGVILALCSMVFLALWGGMPHCHGDHRAAPGGVRLVPLPAGPALSDASVPPHADRHCPICQWQAGSHACSLRVIAPVAGRAACAPAPPRAFVCPAAPSRLLSARAPPTA